MGLKTMYYKYKNKIMRIEPTTTARSEIMKSFKPMKPENLSPTINVNIIV